jgi:hypothetical protein
VSASARGVSPLSLSARSAARSASRSAPSTESPGRACACTDRDSDTPARKVLLERPNGIMAGCTRCQWVVRTRDRFKFKSVGRDSDGGPARPPSPSPSPTRGPCCGVGTGAPWRPSLSLSLSLSAAGLEQGRLWRERLGHFGARARGPGSPARLGSESTPSICGRPHIYIYIYIYIYIVVYMLYRTYYA